MPERPICLKTEPPNKVRDRKQSSCTDDMLMITLAFKNYFFLEVPISQL